MVERLIVALVLAAAGYVAWQLFVRWQLACAAAAAGGPCDPLLAGAPAGTATIVYFTTPTCAPCHLQQTPTLDRLKGELGDALHVVRVDATQQPEAASRWGVVSVPTIFVLRSDGSPHKVYNGVVSASVLKHDVLTA